MSEPAMTRPLRRWCSLPETGPTGRWRRRAAILETYDIGKRHGRRNWALRHLDVAVPDESITALVGPNGTGRSTPLNAGRAAHRLVRRVETPTGLTRPGRQNSTGVGGRSAAVTWVGAAAGLRRR